MKDIMGEIKKEMERQELKQNIIGPEIGCSNLSNNLSGKEQMAFIHFVKLVTRLYRENNSTLITEMIKKFTINTTRDENVRVALEWSIQTGNSETLKVAIKRCKQVKGSKNRKSEKDHKNEAHKQLAKIYELFVKRNELSVNRIEFYMKLQEIQSKAISRSESEVLINIGRLLYYSESGNYRGVLDESDHIKVGNVNQEFLKTSFTLRVLEQKARALIKFKNDFIEAKKLLHKILETDQDLFTLAHISALSLMAELNVLDNYEKSNKYIAKAIETNLKIISNVSYIRQDKMLKSTHDFIQIHHNKFCNLYLTDPAENIFYLVKKGFNEEALHLLEQLEKKNGKLSPFQMYYKALATGEKKYFIESQREFHKVGDFFYSRICAEMLE